MSHSLRIKAIVEQNAYDVTYVSKNGITRSGTGSLTRSNTETEYSVKAHIRDFKPEELSGTLIEFGDRVMRLAGLGLTFTPKMNDTVVHGDEKYRVVSVNTRGSKEQGTLIHIIQLRGA